MLGRRRSLARRRACSRPRASSLRRRSGCRPARCSRRREDHDQRRRRARRARRRRPRRGSCAASGPDRALDAESCRCLGAWTRRGGGGVRDSSSPRRPRVSGAEEGLLGEEVRSTAARSAVTGHCGQRLEERPAVRPRAQAGVEDRDHAAVAHASGSAGRSPAAVGARRLGARTRGTSRRRAPPIRSQRASTSGSPGAANGQLVDHEQRQRLAGDVDPLPERRGGDEHRVDLSAEPLEQPLARRLALDEHVIGDAAADARRRSPRAPGTSSSGRARARPRCGRARPPPRRPARERPARAGRGRAAGQIEERLRAEVVRRADRELARVAGGRAGRGRSRTRRPRSASPRRGPRSGRPSQSSSPARGPRRPAPRRAVGLGPDDAVAVVGVEAGARRRRRAAAPAARPRRPRPSSPGSAAASSVEARRRACGRAPPAPRAAGAGPQGARRAASRRFPAASTRSSARAGAGIAASRHARSTSRSEPVEHGAADRARRARSRPTPRGGAPRRRRRRRARAARPCRRRAAQAEVGEVERVVRRSRAPRARPARAPPPRSRRRRTRSGGRSNGRRRRRSRPRRRLGGSTSSSARSPVSVVSIQPRIALEGGRVFLATRTAGRRAARSPWSAWRQR